MSLMVKYVLAHGSDDDQTAQVERRLSTAVSVGYLWPTLQPWKPASAISLTHCPKEMPMSMLGKSSFHHSVGVTPSFTLCGQSYGRRHRRDLLVVVLLVVPVGTGIFCSGTAGIRGGCAQDP